MQVVFKKGAGGAAVLAAAVFAVEFRRQMASPPGDVATGFTLFAGRDRAPGDDPPARGGRQGADARYVYRDADSKNMGYRTNFMPAEAAEMVKLNMACKTDPHAGETCVRVDVKWRDPNWCGVAVSSQPDYWGEKEKKPAFDLRGAKKMVVVARGAVGGEHIQVKVGIAGDKPFGDSAASPAQSEVVKLGKGWKAIEVDLTGTDLTRVVTPFCFVCSKEYNPKDSTFFLDDIRFEY